MRGSEEIVVVARSLLKGQLHIASSCKIDGHHEATAAHHEPVAAPAGRGKRVRCEMEPGHGAVGLGAGVGVGDGQVRRGGVCLTRLGSGFLRVGCHERDGLGGFHGQVGAQIRDTLAVVVNAVESEAEAGFAPAAFHRLHGRGQNAGVGDLAGGGIQVSELVVGAACAGAGRQRETVSAGGGRAGHASLGGVHYLGIGRAEGGAQKLRIFHAGVAVELRKALPESVAAGDGQGGHLPVHVALVEQLRLAQRCAGKRCRVHAPEIVQDVGFGPDDAGTVRAHVVNLETLGLAHGVLDDGGALGGRQIEEPHLG